MGRQSISLDLPDELYDRVRQIAEDTQRPLESVLVDSLNLLFGTESLKAEQLAALNDDQLWAVVYRPMTWPHDLRLRELTALSKERLLSDREQQELERLVEAYDQFVLLRSQALLLLKQRGHDVELSFV